MRFKKKATNCCTRFGHSLRSAISCQRKRLIERYDFSRHGEDLDAILADSHSRRIGWKRALSEGARELREKTKVATVKTYDFLIFVAIYRNSTPTSASQLQSARRPDNTAACFNFLRIVASWDFI